MISVTEWPGLKHMPEYQNMKRLERYAGDLTGILDDLTDFCIGTKIDLENGVQQKFALKRDMTSCVIYLYMILISG